MGKVQLLPQLHLVVFISPSFSAIRYALMFNFRFRSCESRLCYHPALQMSRIRTPGVILAEGQINSLFHSHVSKSYAGHCPRREPDQLSTSLPKSQLNVSALAFSVGLDHEKFPGGTTRRCRVQFRRPSFFFSSSSRFLLSCFLVFLFLNCFLSRSCRVGMFRSSISTFLFGNEAR